MCSGSVLHQIVREEILPAEMAAAVNSCTGIGQHSLQAGNIQQAGLQDQPLKGFRQADSNAIRILMLQLHHAVHLGAKGRAIRNDEHLLIVMLPQPRENARVSAGGYTSHGSAVIHLPIKLITRMGILRQQHRGGFTLLCFGIK